jgi:hypothetical protein
MEPGISSRRYWIRLSINNRAICIFPDWVKD